MTKHTLESATQQVADAASTSPFPYELGPDGARKVVGDMQAAPFTKLVVEETWITVPASASSDEHSGQARLTAIGPRGLCRPGRG